MSHYRNLGGGKRDDNEPQIMKRFSDHGWHCEQISGNRLWDLLAFNLRTSLHSVRLVDVKMRDGTVTPAQVEKWAALHSKGLPVYVVRTEADVDALVIGELKPWEPEKKGRGAIATANLDAGKRVRSVRDTSKERPRTPRPAYAPPSGMGMHLHGQDVPGPIPRKATEQRALRAAQEAEDTFAPGHEEPETCRVPECDERRVAHGYCAVHALQVMP